MATQLNTSTLSDFTRLADYIFIQALKSVKQAARNSGLFRLSVFPANSGDTHEFNEIDLEQYSTIKDEGDQAEQALVQQGYTKILTLTRYGKDIPITWEMRRRNKYQDVVNRLTNVAKMQANRMDLDLSHRITFATATTYTNKEGQSINISVGDTLALASTAHTLRGTSTTFRNRLANNPQISKGALENMEQMIVENTLDQFGVKMEIGHDILWTTDDPNTINTARELLQATAEVAAPNEGIPNVYRGKYKHVVLPRVATDANGAVDSAKNKYWGLASSSMTTANLAIEQEPTLDAPSAGSNSEEFSTEDWIFRGRASYGITTVSANWFTLSLGDGTA